MSSNAAFITRILDPVIDPRWVQQDVDFEKAFGKIGDHQGKDYIRGYRRQQTNCLDWVGELVLVACTGSRDSELALFDPLKGYELRTWTGEWQFVQSHPSDVNVAAAIEWGGRFRIFDVREDHRYIQNVDLSKICPNMNYLLNLCWSPDANHIALHNHNDDLFMLDIRRVQGASMRMGASLALGQDLQVNNMVWSKASSALWLAGSNGQMEAIPAPELQRDPALSIHAHQHSTVCVAADGAGSFVASGGGDCLVALWDPLHMVCLKTYGFATQSVSTLSFSPDSSLLAWGTGSNSSSGGERNLTIVGTNTNTLYWQDSTPAPVTSVKWHPRANKLAYALNSAQLPDDRDRLRARDTAALHILTLPQS